MCMIVCKWQNRNQLIPIHTDALHRICRVCVCKPFTCKQADYVNVCALGASFSEQVEYGENKGNGETGMWPV